MNMLPTARFRKWLDSKHHLRIAGTMRQGCTPIETFLNNGHVRMFQKTQKIWVVDSQIHLGAITPSNRHAGEFWLWKRHNLPTWVIIFINRMENLFNKDLNVRVYECKQVLDQVDAMLIGNRK